VIDRLLKLKTGPALGLCFLILIIIFALAGSMGQIGADNDDVMRLAQIRDFLAGQNWYDHHQYRMGPQDGGTLMHWSRVIDLPLIILIALFDLLLPYDWAESAAISIWPVATGLALIYSVKLLSRDNPRFIVKPGDLQCALWGFGVLIMGLFLVTFYRFSPGRLDHHNIQLIALALSYVGLADPQIKPRRFVLAGVMTGLSLVIGTEALPFLVVNCGFVALLWAYKGSPVRRAVVGFGAGFAVTLLTGFLIDTPPTAYGQVYCDILAMNYLALGCLGGAGLTGLALLNILDTPVKRLAALGVLGAACGAVLFTLSPQCLSNPLGALPDNVQRSWLDYVEEAQPLISRKNFETGRIFYFIGLIVTAWSVMVWRCKAQGVTISSLYALALSTAIIVMTLYQIRYAAFGLVIGSLILIPWTAECFVAGKAKSKGSVAYIFAFALSAASIWQFPAFMMAGNNSLAPDTDVVDIDAPSNGVRAAADKSEDHDLCFPQELEDYLNAQPPKHILAEPNMTSLILYHTSHSALNGNYHRNAAGIDRAVDIFMRPPAVAAKMMQDDKIDYLFYCASRPAYGIYAKAAPKGLAAQLEGHNALPGFEKLPLELGEGLSLWRLK